MSHLWPYSRDQDGVFVQLQAVCPAAATAAPGAKAGKAAAKAGGARRQKDTGKSGEDQQQGGAPTALAKLWFVRLGEKQEGGGFKARTAHELPQDLSLLPSLLR